MAQKRREESTFTVTDRRLFNSEGELRADVPEEPEAPQAPAEAAKQTPPAQKAAAEATSEAAPATSTAPPAEISDREMPVPPTAAEQDAQAAAYKESSKDLDPQVELS